MAGVSSFCTRRWREVQWALRKSGSDLSFQRYLVSFSSRSLQSPSWDWNPPTGRVPQHRDSGLLSTQGVQCPLPAEGPHRWTPGPLLRRAGPGRRAAPHLWFPVSFASEPSLQRACLPRGFWSAQCPETSRLGSPGQQSSCVPRSGSHPLLRAGSQGFRASQGQEIKRQRSSKSNIEVFKNPRSYCNPFGNQCL